MKTILIATDFSTASRNASIYGWQLAKALHARVILFTAYQVSHPIPALNVEISHFNVRMQTQAKLTDEAEAITGHDAAQIEIVCDEGLGRDKIPAIALEKGADLIIVGMKGSGKNLKRVFGSTVTSLLGIRIPLIIVPEEARYTTPEHIVYASDIFLDTTLAALDQIQWLTAFFGSNLHVVRVVNNAYEVNLEQVNLKNKTGKNLIPLKVTFQFPVNENISDGLDDFMQTQHTDLLVMQPYKHGWLERVFTQSETKAMIFHTHVPLLVLRQVITEPETSERVQISETY